MCLSCSASRCVLYAGSLRFARCGGCCSFPRGSYEPLAPSLAPPLVLLALNRGGVSPTPLKAIRGGGWGTPWLFTAAGKALCSVVLAASGYAPNPSCTYVPLRLAVQRLLRVQ